MLPEKRKRLIIGAIALIVIIIVVILLGKISSFIKNRNNVNEKRNDDYSEIYDYIGITVDEDNVYKVYGINENEEKYLDIKTFYEVKDITNINNKIVLYSDAVNEIRYDNKNNEFYFYELDSNYIQSDFVLLSKEYIYLSSDNKLLFRKYGSENTNELDVSGKFLEKNNKIYYLKDNTLYEYDVTIKRNRIVSKYDVFDNIELLSISNNYLFYTQNNALNAYNLEGFTNINLGEMKFYEISNDGFITYENNKILNYSFKEETFTKEYEVSNIKKIIYLGNNNIYLNFDNNYVIINMQTLKTWKSLENEYIYLMKVKNT